MRRIRRKQRFTWMPTLGGIYQSGDESYGTSFFGSVIAADAVSVGPADLYVTPLVPDKTLFPVAAGEANDGETLRDYTEGQDWLLKRVVGRLNLFAAQISSNDTPPHLVVGAGMFVGRADDSNESVPDTSNVEIDPLGQRNIRQPWLWRRTWLLRNAVADAADNTYVGSLDNVLRAGGIEGPVVDSKIARRIRREERLWFVINAYGGDNPTLNKGGSATYGLPGQIAFNFDYRVLGAMRRSTNKSTF